MLYNIPHKRQKFEADLSEFRFLNSRHYGTNETLNSENYFGGFDQQHDSSPSSYAATELLCNNHSQLLIETYHNIEAMSFWIQGVCQPVVGILGIVFNILAAIILCGSGLKSLFNRLLAWLLFIHTFYIFITLITYYGRTTAVSPDWFIMAFSYALYPLSHTLLHAATFLTVLMARQRYLAVAQPMAYRSTQRTQPICWQATKSSLVVFVFVMVVTFPALFFETSVEIQEVAMIKDINQTHFQYVSLAENRKLSYIPNLHTSII